MPIKDAFEVFIKIFHRDGTEFVKEASDFHAIIGVGIASILRGHQLPIRLVTVLVQVRSVVMEISQGETDIGGSQNRRDRKPDRFDDGDDVQFPAIDPAMPAGFGPVSLDVNRGMRNFPFLPMRALARPHHEHAEWYYRWPLLAHRWPTAG